MLKLRSGRNSAPFFRAPAVVFTGFQKPTPDKVAAQGLRETKRPRLVLALWVAGIALLVLLTVLGVNLPREG